jgi:hypothetical protein
MGSIEFAHKSNVNLLVISAFLGCFVLVCIPTLKWTSSIFIGNSWNVWNSAQKKESASCCEVGEVLTLC